MYINLVLSLIYFQQIGKGSGLHPNQEGIRFVWIVVVDFRYHFTHRTFTQQSNSELRTYNHSNFRWAWRVDRIVGKIHFVLQPKISVSEISIDIHLLALGCRFVDHFLLAENTAIISNSRNQPVAFKPQIEWPLTVRLCFRAVRIVVCLGVKHSYCWQLR